MLFPSIFMAAGIAAGGYFIGNTLYKANTGINIAEVKGLAEQQVEADNASWVIGFDVRTKGDGDIQQLYKRAEESQAKIISFLEENGFENLEITTDAFDYQTNEYRNEASELVDITHILAGRVTVQTAKVHKVKTVRSGINKLIADGIILQNTQPVYRFTNLNTIKPAMLKEATQNARIAANEFAENAGARVGKIKDARQGGFIIRDIGEEYSDNRDIQKTVRVVTTISFYLVD